jgi:glycosyltransferase involved in cell wall biosynthesis
LVLLESMSLNVPIIASNNSAIREVLTPEHRGLVDTGDQKEFASRILDSRSEPLRSAILKFQSKRFRDFSPQKMELDIFRLYSRLTNFTSSY